jgi:acetolactate synthase-1/2/3 large subunit
VILGKAEEEFKAFIEKINLPAAATVMGLVRFQQSQITRGMLGMHGCSHQCNDQRM